MSEFSQRLRERMKNRGELTDERRELLNRAQTSPPLTENTSGHQPTLANNTQTEEALALAFGAPDLRTRLVKYFQYIASNAPLGTMSPLVQALSRRLFPLFGRELEKFSDEEIEQVGMTALLMTAKLFKPTAKQILLDFEHGAMIDTSDMPAPVPDEDAELLVAADEALVETTEVEPQAPTKPKAKTLDEILGAKGKAFAPAPPSFDDIIPPEDEEPIIGIEIAPGQIVQMKQSDYQKLMKEDAT